MSLTCLFPRRVRQLCLLKEHQSTVTETHICLRGGCVPSGSSRRELGCISPPLIAALPSPRFRRGLTLAYGHAGPGRTPGRCWLSRVCLVLSTEVLGSSVEASLRCPGQSCLARVCFLQGALGRGLELALSPSPQQSPGGGRLLCGGRAWVTALPFTTATCGICSSSSLGGRPPCG